MKSRALLFDLDGTLLDSLGDLADSCNAALVHHHLPAHPVEAYKKYVGDGVARLIERVVPPAERDNVKLLAELSQTYRQEYERRWRKSRPYAGMPELLDELVQRGCRLGVLSNKPDDFTRRCVTELLGKWKFDVIMGATAAIPHKPHPAGALQAAAMLGAPPAEVVYLGDTSTDMKTAVAAGMIAVGVLWGFRDRDELQQSGAAHLIAAPADLLAVLQTL